jgi:hypothetical protein
MPEAKALTHGARQKSKSNTYDENTAHKIMKRLRGAFENGRVIVGERERRVRVEVRRRHAVVRTGSVRYVRPSLE